MSLRSLIRFRLIDEYRVSEGVITAPGKFQHEPVFAPYFWDQYMNGLAMEEGDDLIFEISAEDEQVFPELKDHSVVTLREDELGFVHTRLA